MLGISILGTCSEHPVLVGMRQARSDPRSSVVRFPDRLQGVPVLERFALVVHFPDVDPCDPWVLDLKAVAIVPRDPLQAEAAGEGFFQVLGDDRGDGTDVLVVAERVRGAPFMPRTGLCRS